MKLPAGIQHGDKHLKFTKSEHIGNVPLRNMVSTFTKETSLHGVKFVMDECISKPRRFLWAFVILCQLFVFVVLLVNQLIHISERPILTKSTIQYVNRLPFPAVTICNEAYNYSHPLMSEYEEEILNKYFAYNWTFFQTLSEDELSKIYIFRILRKRLLLQKDLISTCSFGYSICTKNVQKIWFKDNLCYTVNSVIRSNNISDTSSSEISPGLVTYSPGLSGGMILRLDLDSLPEKPFSQPGVKVMVHGPDERITVSSAAFLFLAPGSNNFISIKSRKNTFLPPPFKAFGDKKCVEVGLGFTHPLVTKGKYTLRACQDACLLKVYHAVCGCREEVDADVFDECNLAESMVCFKKMWEALNNDSYEFRENACNCPIPCQETIYEPTMSSIGFTDGGDYIPQTGVKIQIYFDRLQIESIDQVEDYTNEDVFASVGGQMGLFLGASLITLVELMELCALFLWRWLARKLVKFVQKVTGCN